MNAIFKTLIVTTALILSVDGTQKTALLSDQSKLTYTITDNKTLNGAYILSTPDDKMSLRGAYKDGVRVGNWYAFNPDGSIFLRYNYDLKKLISIDTVAIGHARFTIAGANEEVKNAATIPVPICSIEQYMSIVGSEFERKIRQENKSVDGSINADLTATVDANGRARYTAFYVIEGVKTSKKIIVNEKMFDLEWIPATYKGEKLAGTFTVNMDVNFRPDLTKRQRFIWNY